MCLLYPYRMHNAYSPMNRALTFTFDFLFIYFHMCKNLRWFRRMDGIEISTLVHRLSIRFYEFVFYQFVDHEAKRILICLRNCFEPHGHFGFVISLNHIALATIGKAFCQQHSTSWITQIQVNVLK